ncbi:hypothetical protein WHR41_02718 [Cladosporium halotolerans]|uniref:Uncharacterized protein n=1 Tax=Cladosporium halotolerans TaxID=1052096 RepID=A0AB34KZN0_9PEZI
MGKSNKFDCTNRRNEGAELGKSIGDAALKELEKTRKDAARHAGKARKASGSSARSLDLDNLGVHFIDLIVPSKALTDDGVAALVEGLYAAMKAGDSQASIVLEGINLRDNRLTTRSLATLAPVIDLAQNELKTIVLSENAITVETDAQAQEFELFLVAFKSCKMLRRLDLSANGTLGDRALEIFCKVHCNEPAIEPIALGGGHSIRTLEESLEDDDVGSAVTDDESTHSMAFDPMTAGVFLHRRCGLRSIPYISFNNIGLSDKGALWLSYILEDHYFPNQLTNEINAAPATTSVDAYQQDAVEGGIDWRGNENTIGKYGLHVLKKTDTVRKHYKYDRLAFSGPGSPTSQSTKDLQLRRFPRTSGDDRRTSLRTLHAEDAGDHGVADLESARKHIQRHIIEKSGLSSIVLWDTALSIVILSRKLAYIAPAAVSRNQYAGPCLFISSQALDDTPDARTERLDSAAIIEASALSGSDGDEGDTNTDPAPSTITRKSGLSYAAALSAASALTSNKSETALTEVTNSPVTPKRTFKAHRKGAFSEGSDLQALSKKLSEIGLQNVDRRPERFLDWQKAKQERENFQYRDTSTACQLPQQLFERIHFLVSSGPSGDSDGVSDSQATKARTATALLSARQLRCAYEWGQNRETLMMESQWGRMTESAQRWMLLEGIECLAYEV